MKKKVKKILIELGCPKYIIGRGLAGLMADWERFSNLLGEGKTFSLDYYLNRLGTRSLLHILSFSIAGCDEPRGLKNISDRLEIADRSFEAGLPNTDQEFNSQLPEELRWLCKGIPRFVRPDKILIWQRALEGIRMPENLDHENQDSQ